MPQLRLRPTTVSQKWGVRNSSDHPMVIQEQMIVPHSPLYTAQKKVPLKTEGRPDRQQIVHLKNGVKKGLKLYSSLMFNKEKCDLSSTTVYGTAPIKQYQGFIFGLAVGVTWFTCSCNSQKCPFHATVAYWEFLQRH